MDTEAPGRPSRSLGRTIGGIGLLALAAIALVVAFTWSEGEDGPSQFHQTVAVDLAGQPLDFAQYEGTPVVLNFFASWCPPCVAEMPALEAIHLDLQGELVVLGLDPSEPADIAAKLVAELGVTYPTGIDIDGVLLDRYEGFGMPTTVFISADGKVLDTHIGALTEGQFRDRIADNFGLG
ncbi:MAG: TlpA disulfide reductase family protein [Acidimicrobiales bacterium]|nr:TlpA family protein disulfide reductase [Acidimicrobiales bacterium]